MSGKRKRSDDDEEEVDAHAQKALDDEFFALLSARDCAEGEGGAAEKRFDQRCKRAGHDGPCKSLSPLALGNGKWCGEAATFKAVRAPSL